MQITKEKAVELFVALGIKTATKWTEKRLTDKVAKINDLVDEDIDLPAELDETLTSVLEAIENDEAIEIAKNTADAPKAKAKAGTKTGAKSKGKAAKAAEAKGDEPEAAPEQEVEEEPKAKAKSKGKAAKAAKAEAAEEKSDAAEAKPKLQNVRVSKSRNYFAGIVIAEFGLEEGITPEMIARLNELYGRENNDESGGVLRKAWHSIRGFKEQKQID